MKLLSDSSARWTVGLGILTVLCGFWALWPHVFSKPDTSFEVVRQAPEQQVAVVPPSGSSSQTATASIRPYVPDQVNLNTASQAQVESLPGIGPKLAQRIIAGRPYKSLADLDRVKGVGEKMLNKLKPLVQF